MRFILKIVGLMVVIGMIGYLLFYFNLLPFIGSIYVSPEKTFDNFINALEGNDPNVASQFFVADKQPQWLKTLEIYQKNNLLKPFAIELKGYELDWKKTTQADGSVSFEITLPSGRKSTITFKKQGDLWKIESL
ncbi:MAG: hypothetical protein UT35_C0019G0002 [Candidatus Yanofskybacteria bacterium GW2011_GWD1_39_16]|uniref:DUF4878 domain-containing protein n=1 Tax=Candidatus Yanofskybacteria bacterium GW2011_GWD1_39_16 TaxID=1619030 RepID=A0A837HZP0_9BACT|nr:MAG: hypothetical protein UT35_C0019G0002 [Candidatus Yanofskybacteria bacterium GW2011_GWD1_39_16]